MHHGIPSQMHRLFALAEPTAYAASGRHLDTLFSADQRARMRLEKVAMAMIGVLLIGGVVAFLQQRADNARIEREFDDVYARLRAIEPGARAIDRSPGAAGVSHAERDELARLRAEVSLLKVRTQELALAVKNGRDVPLNLLPAGAWKNVGRASPEDAAQSLMWAADSGDLEALANSLLLDPGAREQAAAILAQLPDATRATYNTPEKLVALLLAQDTNAKAMQVLNANTAGDDALVTLRLQKDDGKTKEEGYSFRRAPDGWRLVVPPKAVEKLSKKLNDPPKK